MMVYNAPRIAYLIARRKASHFSVLTVGVASECSETRSEYVCGWFIQICHPAGIAYTGYRSQTY